MGFIIFEIIFFAVLLLADLLSKHFVFQYFGTHVNNQIDVIKGVLTFKEAYNDGASLGIFSGKTGLLIGVTVASMVILLGVIVFLHIKKVHRQHTGRFLLCSLLMILSGGIANLYDRIAFNGLVRDFIQYTFLEKIFGTSFFTCNVADVWVCVGVVFIIIYILFMYKEKKPDVGVEPSDLIELDDESVQKALEMLDEKSDDEDKTE